MLLIDKRVDGLRTQGSTARKEALDLAIKYWLLAMTYIGLRSGWREGLTLANGKVKALVADVSSGSPKKPGAAAGE